MEIEFNDDAHEATGAKLYLQLKSGDFYTRKRRGDGVKNLDRWTRWSFPSRVPTGD